MMPNITTLRSSAYTQQNGYCFYCGHPMWTLSIKSFCKKYGLSEGLAKRLKCTAEHLKAKQDGGKDISSNIVAACMFCNQTRHKAKCAKAPQDYKRHVAKRLKKQQWHPKEYRAVFNTIKFLGKHKTEV